MDTCTSDTQEYAQLEKPLVSNLLLTTTRSLACEEPRIRTRIDSDGNIMGYVHSMMPMLFERSEVSKHLFELVDNVSCPFDAHRG